MRELELRGLKYRLIFTGQHLETMQALLDDFQIRTAPTWIKRGKEIDSLARMAIWFPMTLARLIISGRKFLKAPDGRPGFVVIHGDTISTLLAALAFRLRRCRIGHVESGLRSFSIRDPFPEELTRVLVFRLIDIAFCPGEWAVENMQDYRVLTVDTEANTLLDATRFAIGSGSEPTSSDERPRCVASIHRHENLHSKRRLNWIIDLIQDIARSHDVDFVLHPSTRTRLQRTGGYDRLQDSPSVSLRDRMGYIQFIRLLSRSDFVLTDGGSNQEELSYLGVPTLIARERSERKEGLGANAAFLPLRHWATWTRRLTPLRTRRSGKLANSRNLAPSRIIVDWLSEDSRESQGP